ncbi:dTDP-glucose 4,6-dehydratase [Streptomyces muensis]|uniref:dTDP-glucose 4,6-dehydratase n=1 Tax=Streptomyces muensis TaxID=1077944 RepID=A0A9X1PZP5_STRM4|nr:dTDP-glucose 4,6-dehydratase [Streptomyces muensis]MCF1594621.1 dTDP-glucose 4,6-dehydratase [Streptomyces muensis]
MRVLVTGGAGFIGSHYVRTMLAGGYEGYEDAHVTVLDKLTYAGNRENIPLGHPLLDLVVGDICDRDLLLELLPGHDAVVHFAAESHVDRSLASADAFIRTNVLGTQVLLEACLSSGVQRVVHVSTDEVYGTIEHGSWTEDRPLLPNSPYAASKAASDLIARAFWRSHGLDLSITRCSNNYGPHQHPEKLIPLFITNLLEGEQVPVYGDGLNIREWLHVDDHSRAIQLVLTRGRSGEIYNVGGGNERTNLAVTEQLIELVGVDGSWIRYVPDRKGHDQRYSLDETKIREELGYAPGVDFDQGLADTVAWYRDNAHWWKASKHRSNEPPRGEREERTTAARSGEGTR